MPRKTTPSPKPISSEPDTGTDLAILSDPGKNTATSLVSREEDIDPHEPRPGEYWRIAKGFNNTQDYSMRTGVVLLVVGCRKVDGVLHSISIANHPLDTKSNRLYLKDDFARHFRYEPDGESIRRTEIAQIQREAEHEHQKLADGPSSEDLGIDPNQPVATELPALPSGPSAASHLANPQIREKLNLAVQAQIKLAESHATWLTARHAAIQTYAKKLSSFYEEQGAAALARVSEFREYADQLTQGVKTMGLYLGDGVEVDTLHEGVPADPAIPLTLLQGRLYMDEEYAVHLAIGGATWRDFSDFSDALGTDHALRDRVLPFERCVVAMRYRRNARTFDLSAFEGSASDAIAAFIRHQEEEDPNRTTFLLIRNGQNIYRVFSELSTDNATRLFPTETEKGKPFQKTRFHGIDGKNITKENIRYYEAREEFDKIMLFYRRLMVLMWGLDDRLNLFGEFYDRATYPNFMSLQLQTDRFRFIYDDEALSLGEGRLSFTDWWTTRNAYLAPGSRVICAWNAAMNPQTCPGARKHRGDGDYVHESGRSSNYGFEIAFRREDDLYVEASVTHWYTHKPRRVKVRLTGKNVNSQGFLVLDKVALADLDYYINSREARPQYLNFLGIFVEARTILLAEAAAEAALRDSVRTKLDRLNSPQSLKDDGISNAIIEWRATRRGADLPAPTNEITAMLAVRAKNYVSRLEELKERVEAISNSTERTPLRLAKTRAQEIIFYATCLDSEKPFGDVVPFVWVARTVLRPDEELPVFIPERLETTVTEQVLWDWPSAAAHAASGTSLSYSLNALWTARRVLQNAASGLADAFGEAIDVSAIAKHYSPKSQKKDLVVPIGIVHSPDRFGDDATHRNYNLLCLTESIFGTMWAAGEHGRAFVANALKTESERSGYTIDYARNSLPCLEYLPLTYLNRSRDENVPTAQLESNGYCLSYTHSVMGFETIMRVKNEREQGWGDTIADAIVAASENAKDHVVYLAPGVLQWLRGKARNFPAQP